MELSIDAFGLQASAPAPLQSQPQDRQSAPIMLSLPYRLLALLQLTRMALVFTAISNGWASMLVYAHVTGATITVSYAIAMTLVSIGLYTFGMALNDLIDRRRDSQIAPTKPLPSGRMSVTAAHVLCVMLACLALGAGAWMSLQQAESWISLLITAWTLVLILFYDFAGKYLVAPGLISLGLIRFFHATIAAPSLVVPWHAIVLLVHVVVISTFCYGLEGKRPRLTRSHWFLVIGGLLSMILLLLVLLIERRTIHWQNWVQALHISDGLIYPAFGIVGFIVLAILLRIRHPDPRTAGRNIMLYGLLWLIVYDALFVLGYVGWLYALVIVSLFPIALLAVQVMRFWSRLLDLSQKPQYQRAR